MKQTDAECFKKAAPVATGRPCDLRVVKTLGLIRDSFRKLVSENSCDELTVSALCRHARIGRKTFYAYYPSLDALFEEVLEKLVQEYLDAIKDYKAPDNMVEITRKFYEFSTSAGAYYDSLVCSDSYQRLGARLIMRLVKGTWCNAEWFRTLNGVEQDMLLCFIYSSGLGLYRQWVLSGKPVSVEKMISYATGLLGEGIEGFRKAAGQTNTVPDSNI